MGTRFRSRPGIPFRSSFQAGGVVPPVPMRSISSSNRLFSATDLNATRSNFVFNTPYVMTKANSINLVFYNWGFSSGAIALNHVAYTVIDASLTINGITLPITVGGLRSFVVAKDEEEVPIDELTPADFGLTSDSIHGQTAWVKGNCSTAAANTRVLNYSHRSITEASGSQYAWYDPALTTPSSTDVSGAYTATGTALFARAFLFGPFVLGVPPVDVTCPVQIGDSTSAGLTDSASGLQGQGYFSRSMYGLGGTDALPCMNIATGGTNLTSYTGNDKVKNLYKYGNVGCISGYQNDIGVSGSTTLLTMQTRINDVAAEMRAEGLQGIVTVGPLTRTTSANNFIDASQTIQPGWGIGETGPLLKSWLISEEGNLFDLYLSTSETLDSTVPEIWRYDGVASSFTQDGLHIRPNGNIALTAVHAPLWRSLGSLGLFSFSEGFSEGFQA